ncbi:MAG: DUF4176 domain-containing protein [Streptococcaceae bacterium]|nr:DUF4176 domain-containing protein [Streptococcaceae bacterium]
MSEKIPELLPLGTAIKIEGDDSLYIIISRGFQKNNGEVLAGYAGVPHPYGASKKYKTVTIAAKNILEVVQRGYEDELDKMFTQGQLDSALDAPKPTPPPNEKAIAIVPKVETQAAEISPSHPIRKESEYPYDPFYNLKHKVKENKK